MAKTLVAYFSASGTTARIAAKVAKAANADLFEIVPAVPYTNADLDWMNSNSRTTIEMNDPDSRPAIASQVTNMAQYDTVLIGFPIWWYVAPTIIRTFLEAYDLSGKKLALFATSGGSGFGKTVAVLEPSAPRAAFVSTKLLNHASDSEIRKWVENL